MVTSSRGSSCYLWTIHDVMHSLHCFIACLYVIIHLCAGRSYPHYRRLPSSNSSFLNNTTPYNTFIWHLVAFIALQYVFTFLLSVNAVAFQLRSFQKLEKQADSETPGRLSYFSLPCATILILSVHSSHLQTILVIQSCKPFSYSTTSRQQHLSSTIIQHGYHNSRCRPVRNPNPETPNQHPF